jgi:hypothetical protein
LAKSPKIKENGNILPRKHLFLVGTMFAYISGNTARLIRQLSSIIPFLDEAAKCGLFFYPFFGDSYSGNIGERVD